MNVGADYARLDASFANALNRKLIRTRNMLGTIGIVEVVCGDEKLKKKKNVFGEYRKDSHTIAFRTGYSQMFVRKMMERSPDGKYSTKSEFHPYRHEIGHAIWEYYKEYDGDFLERMNEVYLKFFEYSHEGEEQLSEYAAENASEMFAEAIAEILEGSPRELALAILKQAIGRSYDDVFPNDG